MKHEPTYPAERTPGLSPVLERNIAALQRRQQEVRARASMDERIADAITAFAGTMRFVYLHLALFGGWIIVNLGLIPGLRPFDPSFVVLAMVASVEAIFLSTFVLISQNRMAAAADRRADLDLQVSLLAEHEITKLIALASGIAEHLKVKPVPEDELAEVARNVAPEAVLDEIEARDT